jgi:hypothetical protein
MDAPLQQAHPDLGVGHRGDRGHRRLGGHPLAPEAGGLARHRDPLRADTRRFYTEVARWAAAAYARPAAKRLLGRTAPEDATLPHAARSIQGTCTRQETTMSSITAGATSVPRTVKPESPPKRLLEIDPAVLGEALGRGAGPRRVAL